MASSVNITKVRFSIALLFVCLIASVLSVKVDEETKAFIRLVIENSNGEAFCFSSGPIRAIPRGTRVRRAVGCSPGAPGGGGGGTPLYVRYIGMCRPEGYGF